MNDEGHACATLISAILTATKSSRRAVLAHEFFRLIYVTIIKHRTVVARKDNYRILKQPLLFERADNLAYAPVKLHNGIAAQTHFALSAETLVGEAGHVNVVRGEVHEEGLLAILTDKVHGVHRNAIGNVLILPKRLTAALHVTNAPDAVDDRVVVSVTRLQVVTQFGIGSTRGFAVKILIVIHIDGRRGVVVSHRTVLNEHTRHAVRRSRHDVGIVKTNVCQRWRNRGIPILLARFSTQSEVPFAEGGGSVTCFLKDISHGVLVGRNNHTRISSRNVRTRLAPRILPRE